MSGKGIGTPGNRELAFAVYREFGGRNIPRVLAEIRKRHGFGLTAPTLYRWRDDGDWDGRIKRADATRAELAEEGLGFNEKMFRSLLDRKRAYDQYFMENRIDNQAQYAYNALVETLIKLAKNIEPDEASDPAAMKANIDEVLAAEYGINR